MNLSLDENQAAIREAIQAYVRSEVTPKAEAWDASKTLTRERMQGLAELGMLGLMVSEAAGGVGLSMLDAALVLAQVGRGDGGLAVAMANHAVVALPQLERDASASVKDAWLERCVSGEALCAWALEESGGATLNALETRAEESGEGWSLSGAKRLVACGELADLFLVVARIGDDEVGTFAVPRDSSGVKVEKPSLLGLRSGGLVDLELKGVELNAEARLCGGQEALAEALARFRCALGAVAFGLGKRANECGASYALERKQFGQPIARFQAIQNRLADAEVGVQAAGALVEWAASEQGKGRVFGASTAKAFVHASRAAFDAADHAIQIHGGYGYVREYQVERMWRDAKTLAALAGGAREARDSVAEAIYS